MQTIYAKISEEANLNYDNEKGKGETVYLKLVDAPDTANEDEIKDIISELTEVDAKFISVVTEEEFNANVDTTDDSDGCSDCSGCSCG